MLSLKLFSNECHSSLESGLYGSPCDTTKRDVGKWDCTLIWAKTNLYGTWWAVFGASWSSVSVFSLRPYYGLLKLWAISVKYATEVGSFTGNLWNNWHCNNHHKQVSKQYQWYCWLTIQLLTYKVVFHHTWKLVFCYIPMKINQYLLYPYSSYSMMNIWNTMPIDALVRHLDLDSN